ncbi:MAG: 50S ribosomal protein L6 [Tenericutes bacterium]|jgi:large subunit ribosomal protein L6|nr:50S ribosomal protein L6 [Mycoplasmatota bacterium]
MSRIGNRKISIPENVTVNIDNQCITVKGPKGELSTIVGKSILVKQIDDILEVSRIDDEILSKSLHGTANSNIQNLIIGVTEGYQKGLEIIGVGYRFTLKGKELVINAGYSHPVEVIIPEDLTVELINNTEIVVKGIDKIKVGEFAANIRKVRKPEPYKGKGIRYKDEYVRRKEGKKAAK